MEPLVTGQNIPLAPPTGFYNERPAWKSENGRGVFIGDATKVKCPAASLMPRVVIRGDAEVRDAKDVLTIGAIGSRSDFLTVTFRPALQVTTGCVTSPLEDFLREVRLKAEDDLNRLEYEATCRYVQEIAAIRARPRK